MIFLRLADSMRCEKDGCGGMRPKRIYSSADKIADKENTPVLLTNSLSVGRVLARLPSVFGLHLRSTFQYKTFCSDRLFLGGTRCTMALVSILDRLAPKGSLVLSRRRCGHSRVRHSQKTANSVAVAAR